MAGWPIHGPRSVAWVCAFLARANSAGPEAYHRWWRSVCRLSVADWGVAEHQQLCRYLQLGGSYDQLDLTNLAIIEAIARRLQLIEYQYRERAKAGSHGGGGPAWPPLSPVRSRWAQMSATSLTAWIRPVGMSVLIRPWFTLSPMN